MKVHKIPYYEIDHEKVRRKFNGKPSYLNTMTITYLKKEFPFNVYKIIEPQPEEPNKKFLLLREIHEVGEDGEKEVNLGVILADEADMEPERFQRAAHCLECDHVVYSMFSGDMHTCPCMKTTVSGGKDIFIRKGAYRDVVVDLLTDQVMPDDFQSEFIQPAYFGMTTMNDKNEMTESGLIIPTIDQIAELGESIGE